MMTHKGFFVQPDRKVKPCCIFTDFDTPVLFDESKTYEEMMNSPQFMDLRNKMDNGIVHKGCSACFTGKSPMRQGLNTFLFNDDYNVLKNILPESKKATDIWYLDLRLSNLCNFKCRMCNDTYSSSWAQELTKLKLPLSDNKFSMLSDSYLNQIVKKIKDLKYLYLGGGEPFIMKETFELLRILTDEHKSKITLALNTNLSNLTYKGIDIIDELGKFKDVYFNVSCDGIGEIGEYQRTGFKTETFKHNVLRVLGSVTKYPQFNVGFTYAIGAVNLFHLPKFVEYVSETFKLEPKHCVDLQFIEFPWYYNVGNSSEEFLNRAKSFILDYINQLEPGQLKHRLEDYYKFIQRDFYIPTGQQFETEIRKTRIVDKHRNESLLDIAPWVDEHIIKYNSKNII